jgi:hypothetical protein
VYLRKAWEFHKALLYLLIEFILSLDRQLDIVNTAIPRGMAVFLSEFLFVC